MFKILKLIKEGKVRIYTKSAGRFGKKIQVLNIIWISNIIISNENLFYICNHRLNIFEERTGELEEGFNTVPQIQPREIKYGKYWRY